MLPIRNISYLLPMCCSFWEKCINSQKTGLVCSTPALNDYTANVMLHLDASLIRHTNVRPIKYITVLYNMIYIFGICSIIESLRIFNINGSINTNVKAIFKTIVIYIYISLNVNEWKFHSPIEWNSCKPLKKRVVLYVKQQISTHKEWKSLQKEWITTHLRS